MLSLYIYTQTHTHTNTHTHTHIVEYMHGKGHKKIYTKVLTDCF